MILISQKFTLLCLFIFSYLTPALAQSFYLGSPVLELTGSSFKKQVIDTRHPTIVEFYAPWCGHCQNLKRDYLKAAKSLHGIANLAAIDCDEDSNKPICEQYNVKGFPTLKIFGPTQRTKGTGKSEFVSDYNGPRTAKAIRGTLIERLNGAGVKTISSVSNLNDKFSHRPRVVLMSSKKQEGKSDKSAPAVFKSLAIEFDQRAFLKNKDESPIFAYMHFNPPKVSGNEKPKSSYLAVYHANDTSSPIIYEEAMDRESIKTFLLQHFDVMDPLDPSERKSMNSKKRKEIRDKRLKLREQQNKSENSNSTDDSKKSTKSSESSKSTKSTKSSIKSSKSEPVKTKKKASKKAKRAESSNSKRRSETPSESIPSDTVDINMSQITGQPASSGGGNAISGNRIYSWTALQDLCFNSDEKSGNKKPNPCFVCAVSFNEQIGALNMLQNSKNVLPSRLNMELPEINWAYFIDLSTSPTEELSVIADTLGLRPYFPSDWKVANNFLVNEDMQKHLLKELGLDEIKVDSKHWSHPPSCVYINGQDDWLLNFPKYTEVNEDSVTKFLKDTISEKNKGDRKKLPKKLNKRTVERDEL